MAYADTNTNPRKLGAGAAVLALEGALAWALIAGLAYTATPKDEHRLDTFDVPAITPEPAPPPKPAPDHRTIDAPVLVPSPSVAITIRDPFTYASSEPSSGEETTGAISDVSFKTPEPTATASAKPLFTPKGAKPKNDSSRWLTTDDYPTRGLLNQLEGRTSYRLSVDASGKVTGCAIVASSGHPVLDQATCQLLPRRAKFDPARDDSGAAVSGTYTGWVTWRLPPEE